MLQFHLCRSCKVYINHSICKVSICKSRSLCMQHGKMYCCELFLCPQSTLLRILTRQTYSTFFEHSISLISLTIINIFLLHYKNQLDTIDENKTCSSSPTIYYKSPTFIYFYFKRAAIVNIQIISILLI